MSCECCANTAKGDYRLCADRCTHCQARRIQLIQRLPISPVAIGNRCRAVIADCNAWGLDETTVRRLAKGQGWAVQAATTTSKG